MYIFGKQGWYWYCQFHMSTFQLHVLCSILWNPWKVIHCEARAFTDTYWMVLRTSQKTFSTLSFAWLTQTSALRSAQLNGSYFCCKAQILLGNKENSVRFRCSCSKNHNSAPFSQTKNCYICHDSVDGNRIQKLNCFKSRISSVVTKYMRQSRYHVVLEIFSSIFLVHIARTQRRCTGTCSRARRHVAGMHSAMCRTPPHVQ